MRVAIFPFLLTAAAALGAAPLTALAGDVSVGQVVTLGTGTGVIHLGVPSAGLGIFTVRIDGPTLGVAGSTRVAAISEQLSTGTALDPLAAYIYSSFRSGSILDIPVNADGFGNVCITSTDPDSLSANNSRLLAAAIRMAQAASTDAPLPVPVPIAYLPGGISSPDWFSTTIDGVDDGAGDSPLNLGLGSDSSINEAVSAFRTQMQIRMNADIQAGRWSGIGNVRIAQLELDGFGSGSVGAMVLVPTPVSLAMGAAGLAGLAGSTILRRRRV